MKKYIVGFLFLLLILPVSAQVAMGKWSTHFAYNSVSQIAQSENKIYAVSEGALFSIDKQDGVMEFYSNISGLHASNISRIDYDYVNHELLIIYSNGNIDVLSTRGVTNIPDFYSKQMNSKDVNQIQFYQNKAYLSCNFGILVLNMATKEVLDTYFIGPNASEVKVLNTTIYNGNIYALTASTIFQASINEPQLVNYQFWGTTSGLPGSGDFQKIAAFAGQLILLRQGNLYKKGTDNLWVPFLSGVSVSDFNTSNGSLNIFSNGSVYLIDNQFNSTTVTNVSTVTDAEFDSQNATYYFAGNSMGVIIYKPTDSNPISYRKPVGPAVNMPWDMTFSGQKLFVVPGGRSASVFFRDGDIMMYEKGVWTNILANQIQDSTKYHPTDFMDVSVDKTDNSHFFVTSMGSGLYEFKKNKFFKWYNFTNSPIESVVPSQPYSYMYLNGSVFDESGNLWFINNSVPSGEIKVLKKDGTWAKLFFNGFRPTPGKLMISNQNQNQKWMPSLRVTPGVFIFDDGGIFDNSKSIFLNKFTYSEIDNNSGLSKLISAYPSNVYTCVQDKNGVVWVGTDIGPFLFNNSTKVFDAEYTCSRVKIPRNDNTNLADYLLVNERIRSIAIDGANRKWIGTESSGVYLMSENGQQTIQHFTSDNSPLLSNTILSLGINPVTGEVFFGTDQGIVSYQSDASNAGSTFDNVYAYPNPVRQGYNGVITITGLVENTQVKITDINGNLVCQTVSNGSLATWNGKDVNGRKVNTGIYLAICASSDGSQSTITKILVIN
jgi:hypothetical protein